MILAMSDLQVKGVTALQQIILAYREQSEDTASKSFDGSKHITSPYVKVTSSLISISEPTTISKLPICNSQPLPPTHPTIVFSGSTFPLLKLNDCFHILWTGYKTQMPL